MTSLTSENIVKRILIEKLIFFPSVLVKIDTQHSIHAISI